MTKKEKQQLHRDKCQLECVDAQLGRGLEKRYIVAFSLAPGELIALKNALVTDSANNPISDDVLAFLNNAFERAKIKTT